MTDLAGKVALVTGGSRGIGAAIARRLARDGADVALTYARGAEASATVVQAIEAMGRRGVALQADSADPDVVVRAVEETVRIFGRIDILVNNAGVYAVGPIEEVAREELERVLAIHVTGVFVATQAAARRMADGGRIISIGSCLAQRVPGPGTSLYAMTKSALIGLTKGVARDLGPRGITVNVVEPGPTDTNTNPADGPGADDQRALLALDHFGVPDDIAATVAHLAGPGGRYITGAAIAVDGGSNA